MKLTTLTERIEKADATIAKKTTTIEKKIASISKKTEKLEAMGYKYETYFEARDFSNDEAYDLAYSIRWFKEDIERLEKEIEEKKETLEKYRKQMAGELERESVFLKEIPEAFKSYQDELVNRWDEWDKAHREDMKKKYDELGYRGFFDRYSYSDYEIRHKTDKEIHEANVEDAKRLILNLYYRVKDITGEVTSWDDLYITNGNGGAVINGFVIGKEGRAKVESILAGGYNIQRLHVRVLVHEY